MNEITHKEIWNTLSKINVNQYTEDKYGLTFLPWVYSWHLLQEHFPEAQYDFDPNEIHADGSVTVHCTVSIGSCARSMHLPVMDNKMKSQIQPSSRDISDAKQRCLVKCIGMHGLGIYLARARARARTRARTRARASEKGNRRFYFRHHGHQERRRSKANHKADA